MKQNLGRDPLQVVADGGFTNRGSIVKMEARGIDLIGSLPDRNERSEAAMKSMGIEAHFAPHFFIFQPESKTMQCPAGKRLAQVGQSWKRGNRYQQYRADGNDCQRCEYQRQCCPAKPWKGRTVSRLEKEDEVVKQFRDKMDTEQAQQAYRRRGAIAEFPFAWIKEKIGLRKFHVFGLKKVRLEAVWACLTYNAMIWARLCWRPEQAAAA